MIKLFIDSSAISSVKYCAQSRRKRTDKWNIRRRNRSLFSPFAILFMAFEWNYEIFAFDCIAISATKEWPEREENTGGWTGKSVHKLSSLHWFSMFIWRMIEIIVNRKCFKNSFNHFRLIISVKCIYVNYNEWRARRGKNEKIKLSHIANKLLSNLISIQSFGISEVPSPPSLPRFGDSEEAKYCTEIARALRICFAKLLVSCLQLEKGECAWLCLRF